jgi:hypothetical protein
MSSSYLDNIMRSGAQAFNAKVTLAGTTVTVSSYDNVPYSPINPMLLRFSNIETAMYTGANISMDFSGVAFNKEDYDGVTTMFVGLLRVSETEVVPTLSLSGESGEVNTYVSPKSYETYCSTGATGQVMLIARLMNVERINGAWVTTNAWVEE